MAKRLLATVAALLILLGVAYMGTGYVLYNRLADVKGACDQHVANRPDNFTVLSADKTDWEDFDFSPYFMPGYEPVRLPSREPGITIAGWYVEKDPAAPVVLVVHGFGVCKNHHDVLTPAGVLSKAGFNVLLIDLRDAGESDYEDGRTAIGNEEYLDALGAWDWLQAEKGFPDHRIGILGNSMGAATALIAFEEEPRLAAIWVDSPFSNLPMIIREELARENLPGFLYLAGILNARVVAGDNLVEHNPEDAVRAAGNRPMYIVHGTADSRIGYHHTQRLARMAEEMGADATIWIIDGVEHVRAIATHTAEYEERLVGFFRQALGDS